VDRVRVERGNDGQITFREWHPVGVEEYGYAVPDPRIRTSCSAARSPATIAHQPERQRQPTGWRPRRRAGCRSPARAARTQPLAFCRSIPTSVSTGQRALEDVDSGHSWKQISPELNRKQWDTPKTISKYYPQPQGTGAPTAGRD
jgi:hypothetical protein